MPDGTPIDRDAIAGAVAKMATAQVLGRRDRTSATPRQLLELISVCAAIADAARSCLDASVADSRRAGSSWTEIGQALGVTRQAAFRRFGREPGPSSTREQHVDAPADEDG